jgi:hypothetical protein
MNLILPFGLVSLFAIAVPGFAADDQGQDPAAHTAQPGAFKPTPSFIRSSRSLCDHVFRAPALPGAENRPANAAAEFLRAEPQDVELICGLTVRHVDERNDPRIIIRRREDHVDARIRRIAPEVCRNEPRP